METMLQNYLVDSLQKIQPCKANCMQQGKKCCGLKLETWVQNFTAGAWRKIPEKRETCDKRRKDNDKNNNKNNKVRIQGLVKLRNVNWIFPFISFLPSLYLFIFLSNYTYIHSVFFLYLLAYCTHLFSIQTQCCKPNNARASHFTLHFEKLSCIKTCLSKFIHSIKANVLCYI